MIKAYIYGKWHISFENRLITTYKFENISEIGTILKERWGKTEGEKQCTILN